MTRASGKDRGLNLFCFFRRRATAKQKNRGQALVEFTLIFVLFLIVAWIPADFGLAFLTGQLAQNASREGARIAAADPCLLGTTGPSGPCLIPGIANQTGSCALGANCSNTPGSVMAETAERLSSALLAGATITVTYPVAGGACNNQVRVEIAGNYNYFFLQLFRLMGFSSTPDSQPVTRTTDMRWEHQACP